VTSMVCILALPVPNVQTMGKTAASRKRRRRERRRRTRRLRYAGCRVAAGCQRVKKLGDVPVIVAGDLNDVAWSRTTHLFQRTGGLLDPRVGRGFFNTFDTRSRLTRVPLDHVFASRHFLLVELRRLPDIGSDHFPIIRGPRLRSRRFRGKRGTPAGRWR
jgi:endonuclease/exonuclease/phosphatase (EEP) superfamily protein YafD